MFDMSFIIPYLPFIGVLIGAIIPVYLMRLQANKLRQEIKLISQTILTSKNNSAKDQATAIETLERVASTTAEELEKSLQKSITMRNLIEQVDLQKIQILEQRNIIDTQSIKINKLMDDLSAERVARQTAVAEIELLKSSSDGLIQRLTARVKTLEDYILQKGLTIPNGV